MSDVQMPSESERKAFIEKLGAFRNTLPQSEQRMLDAMAIAAFGAHQQPKEGDDVQGYGWVWGPAGWVWQPATFWQTGYAIAPVGTPWGVALTTVPTGVWTP